MHYTNMNVQIGRFVAGQEPPTKKKKNMYNGSSKKTLKKIYAVSRIIGAEVYELEICVFIIKVGIL